MERVPKMQNEVAEILKCSCKNPFIVIEKIPGRFSWFFMVFHGSRLVFLGSRSAFIVFHGSRWVFMAFHGSRLVFHFSRIEHPETVFWPDDPI